MEFATLERWIKNLGASYDFLVAQGIISNLPLQDLYESGDSLEIEPECGIELSFWAHTKRFEAIQINLADDSDGLPRFVGKLPAPYSAALTKLQVRTIFGVPLRSTSGFQLPNSLKASGGWDSYQLPKSLHSEALVDFQYTDRMQVDRLVFSLIDRH